MNTQVAWSVRSAADRAVSLLAAALLAVSLASCGSATGSVSGDATVGVEGTASVSATDIADSLAAAGLPCMQFSTRAGGTHVASEARCSIGEDDVIIRAFETAEERNLYMEASGNVVEQLSFDIDAPPRLVGPTWIVTTDTRATAEKIQRVLGGELR